MWGSPMADANVHNHRRCPLVLLGKGNGMLTGNLHIKAADGTPMANAMLAPAQATSASRTCRAFGDSTGELSLTQSAITVA